MKVAWLAAMSNTDGSGIGGAEMTQAEFKAAAPDGVKVVYVPKDGLELARDCDVVCVHNCPHYPAETVGAIEGKRVVRYWNDTCPHGSPDLRDWLLANSVNVFCSPLHYERFPWRNGQKVEYHLIPPPIDLQPFRDAGAVSKDRSGAVSIAPWRGWGKNPAPTLAWGETNGGVDVYGGGQLAPPGSVPVPYDQMPALLAKYQTFVYLPTALEPFCRVVAEADAAGCEIVANRLVGALHWLENDRDRLDSAREDYWNVVLGG